MFSLESFHKEYETETTEFVVCGRKFRLYVPSTIERFINPEDVFKDFPLWSKVWEASWVLSDYLARLPVCPEKRFLEIGAGLGLISIVGASFGHKITLTDNNPLSLNFARANALLNQCSNLEIKELDWNQPDLEGRFDYILGSESLYTETSFNPLVKLFKSALKSNGEIILTSGVRKTTIEFFKQMQRFYNITAQKKVLRSQGESFHILLCRMTPR
ncbi:MAG: methyltransferase domain-containing protein [Deltaproteobacteria bacterium]|nr:methyltransferase domain-containing protein [Deltaproteobacteria bacterium]MBW2152890.1 methyltransferase domain-containing protein [Deltaproteobacteria bacterium]